MNTKTYFEAESEFDNPHHIIKKKKAAGTPRITTGTSKKNLKEIVDYLSADDDSEEIHDYARYIR